MHRMIWLCCVVGLLTVVVAAQAPQNPALAGGERVAQIPDTNPFSSEADIQAGEALFQKHCSYCHGSFGEGGRGADLTTGVYRRGGRDPELYGSIRNGIPGSEMAPVRVTDDEVWQMVGVRQASRFAGIARESPRRCGGGAGGLSEAWMRHMPYVSVATAAPSDPISPTSGVVAG